MPVVSARSQKLEIYFKESWVVEPDYAVTVKTQSPASFVLLDILQPIDPKDRWLLKDFPSDRVYPPYCEGLYASSGSIKNQHLSTLYFMSYAISPLTDKLHGSVFLVKIKKPAIRQIESRVPVHGRPQPNIIPRPFAWVRKSTQVSDQESPIWKATQKAPRSCLKFQSDLLIHIWSFRSDQPDNISQRVLI
jgi:hypothetical protein